jgi:hypothetical protein
LLRRFAPRNAERYNKNAEAVSHSGVMFTQPIKLTPR